MRRPLTERSFRTPFERRVRPPIAASRPRTRRRRSWIEPTLLWGWRRPRHVALGPSRRLGAFASPVY